MTLMKVNRIPSLIRIDVFYSNDFREDEKNLLMVELARVRKEKELAKQKEVRVLYYRMWIIYRKKRRHRWKQPCVGNKWFTRILCSTEHRKKDRWSDVGMMMFSFWTRPSQRRRRSDLLTTQSEMISTSILWILYLSKMLVLLFTNRNMIIWILYYYRAIHIRVNRGSLGLFQPLGKHNILSE